MQHFHFRLITLEESKGVRKIFDFWFLLDLHVLGCLEHGLTTSGKCLFMTEILLAILAQKLMDGFS